MKQLLLLLICAATATGMQAQSFSLNDFRKLGWLTASWKLETKTGPLYEIWHSRNDSTFQNHSFKIRTASGDTVSLEKVQLCFRDGKVFYIPVVNGQNNNEPVPFRVTAITDHSFKAENAEHDFPQFIEYTLESPAKLRAIVYGKVKGQERKEEFAFSKITTE